MPTTGLQPFESARQVPDAALRLRDLSVTGRPSEAGIVLDVSLDVLPGEILGVVGESGSGKTTLGLALLNYCKAGTYLSSGSVVVDGHDIGDLTAAALQRFRGGSVAYIPQSPAAALNPALRIGTQLRECLPAGTGRADGQRRVREVVAEVALPEDPAFLRRYPHQLSGGQQQRVAIAMAFIPRPRLIVLDEPTTGLDVTTQAVVLDTVRQLCQEYGCAGVYISHDMAVVADLADFVAVMYSGRVVESGPTQRILTSPQHPYTRRLLLAVPDLAGQRRMTGIPGHAPSPLHRPPGCAFAPRCPLAIDRCRTEAPSETVTGERSFARCHRAGEDTHWARPTVATEEPLGSAQPLLRVRDVQARYGRTVVLRDVALDVHRGECVALLGESGSGKTTLSRVVAGLHDTFDGTVQFGDQTLSRRCFDRTAEQQARIQYIFQDPYESLNPRRTVRDLVLQPLRALRRTVRDPHRVVATALEQVALRADLAGRYPDQLSGGERQRVAIARALTTDPDLMICDEITSALDVSVQSSLVELLQQLQEDIGLSMLFITHNIALVRNIAQRVAVLQHGSIVQLSTVAEAFAPGADPYTKSLIAGTPNISIPIEHSTTREGDE